MGRPTGFTLPGSGAFAPGQEAFEKGRNFALNGTVEARRHADKFHRFSYCLTAPVFPPLCV
jgi:hypothetical protein